MKKLMLLLALCALGVGCDEPPSECDYAPEAYHCVVYVNTTPGQETVLLAKSGVYTTDEKTALFSGFEAECGEGNVVSNVYDPYHKGCKTVAPPDAVPDCYELTLTVDMDESIQDTRFANLLVKTNGRIRIYKLYQWAFNEEDAYKLVPWLRNLYVDYGEGEIVGIAIKNLGPEAINEPIIF